MVTSPTPTRAEVNDIFNTLNDGADGLVLAAETAIGAYPVQCAMMVSRMISQFSQTFRSFSVKSLRSKNSFLLVEPHGGTLVDRTRFDTDGKKIRMKALDVEETVLLSAEQIALGTFSPLQGFMTRNGKPVLIAAVCRAGSSGPSRSSYRQETKTSGQSGREMRLR